MFSTKTSAAGLSIISNSVLVILKIAAGVVMGSVSVLSEGIHSGVDLLAALIAFFSIRAAAKPADEEHQFGHGKIENVSGTIEAILIFLAAFLIIYQAAVKIQKILIGAPEVERLGVGIALMAFSAVVNIFVSRHLHRIGRKTDSVALEADAWHLTTDVYTSLGVMAGLALVWVMERFIQSPLVYILDPLIAIAVAFLIIRAAWNITRKSFGGLVDVRLPRTEEDLITASITEHLGEVAGFHELRTRKAGSQRYIDLHLVLPKSVSLAEAHKMCDHLEVDITSKLSNGLVTIHCEPCDQSEDGNCPSGCPVINCRVNVEKRELGQSHMARLYRSRPPRLLRRRRPHKEGQD